MRRRAFRKILRRAIGVALLGLSPALLLDGLETHPVHAEDGAGALVFSDARHAGESQHWEPAGKPHPARCSDCLAPGQAPEAPPAGPVANLGAGANLASVAVAPDPLDPAAGRSHRPRGPPPSGLS